MRSHHMTKHIWRFLVAGLSLAKFPSILGMKDVASSNSQLAAHLQNIFPDLLQFFFDCLNHRNMTGHLDVVFAVFLPEYL